MQPQDEIVPLLVGPPQALQEFADALQRAGIAARFVRPPKEADRTGTKVGLAVAKQDVAAALRAIEAQQQAGMSETELKAAQTVVDREREENVCPACETPFRGQVARCPECGLNFGE